MLRMWLWQTLVFPCLPSGDPRRPYPVDMEMKAGVLGRLSAGVSLQSKGSENGLGPAHTRSNIPTSIVGMSVCVKHNCSSREILCKA